MSTVRINKFLAHATGMSRRQADEAVARRRVTVDGAVAEMGAHVEENARVTLDGALVGPRQSYTYLLLHKPTNYVCSRRRQGETPTIYELLPEKYRALKPVGRLDKDSSGLLFMTDDGDFAHRMTHPKFVKTKVYEVELKKPLEPLHQQMISDIGITLADGVSQFMIEKIDSTDSQQPTADRKSHDNERTTSFLDTSATSQQRGAKEKQLAPSGVERKDSGSELSQYRITMHEGRNRQIRRTFGSLGYMVMNLHRTSFGNYSLGDIKSGEHKVINIS